MLIIKVFKMNKKRFKFAKKVLWPKFSPIHSEISWGFQICEQFFSPSTKNRGKLNFLWNLAHLSFALLHICHLFTSHMAFVQNITISSAFVIWATVLQSFLTWNAHTVFYQAHIRVYNLRGKILHGATYNVCSSTPGELIFNF